MCVLPIRSLQNDSTEGKLKSERSGTTANFTLLLEALFWGTTRASYLLLLCKFNPFNESLKLACLQRYR